MPAKWLITLLLVFPALLFASQEEDMELFEFLAMYDQNDNAFIDAEIEQRIENKKTSTDVNEIDLEVPKSVSDEN